MIRALAVALLLVGCASTQPDNPAVCRAVAAGASRVEVTAGGNVTRLLGASGTHEGLMMQLGSDCRAAIRIEINTDFSGVLPAHVGEAIVVRGELETDSDGPVIHWAHRDPRGHHDGGYVQLGSST